MSNTKGFHKTRLYLVTGWGKGPREAEKGQSQVDEAILIGLKVLVSLYLFVQLQTYKVNYSCCGCSNGWDDLPCNQLALWHRMWQTEVVVKRGWGPTEKVICDRFKFGKGSRLDLILFLPYASLQGECYSALPGGWMQPQWNPCESWCHHPIVEWRQIRIEEVD